MEMIGDRGTRGVGKKRMRIADGGVDIVPLDSFHDL